MNERLICIKFLIFYANENLNFFLNFNGGKGACAPGADATYGV